ncbi:hypothetical protein [Ruixingdingia sedimenti]|uniref:Uncharacterized protein n=1 Tax=Ruixingdingia sedimenti TaxID=3073604 RepID=A0ABU1F4C1_9RHOB|nr:hypothetical protein [Xinfangfangia sp. LG-4]MDR5651716.1 hypothetical protein [Xinfangfangia sp. LG-4]
MNVDQIINRLIRLFTRKAVNYGVRKGADMAAGKGKPAAQMTKAEREQARKMRETIKTARRAARLTRRIGR